MVAGEPDLVEIPKLFILGHLLRRQMTVIVENRFLARVVMVKFASQIRLQEKMIGDKRFHRAQLFLRYSTIRFAKYRRHSSGVKCGKSPAVADKEVPRTAGGHSCPHFIRS